MNVAKIAGPMRCNIASMSCVIMTGSVTLPSEIQPCPLWKFPVDFIDG